MKRAAGEAAARLVESGMRIGLGTGSTANPFIEAVGRRLADGEISNVVGVATSLASARLAEQVGIPIEALDASRLDLVVDGADEIAPGLDLIKGLGAAHLREKVVASQAERFVIVADDSKLVPAIGSQAPVPLEVVEFGLAATAAQLEDLGEPILRVKDGRAVTTDNGNPVIDLWTGQVAEPDGLDRTLQAIPGVLATGLFVAMADAAIVASESGLIHLDRTFDG
jgi:ribose 5-phosphate isomerase A